MKKTTILSLAAIALLSASSCKKYLDINKNPNAATSATPELILPQALVYTAGNANSYNTYGAELGGYSANAGGYGGFGSNWTYDFGPNDYSGLWSSTYDVLNDFQNVINTTAKDATHLYYNGIARIMKTYNFELLVDAYNNVPYAQALNGLSNVVSPKYDDAKTIYPELANQLDSAIAIIKQGQASATQSAITSANDPIFGGDPVSWIQFANTIKLRLIIRASGTASFSNTTFDNNGFLTKDAIVNPGYAKVSGQQNPSWNTWVKTYDGTAGNRAWMPCTFAFAFYNGGKLTDNGRGNVIYYKFPATPNNQLGVGTTAVPSAPTDANAWYSGDVSSLGNTAGIMKGLNMGEPLVLAAESWFLQAEAQVRGIIGGTAQTSFNNGIEASFNYLYLLPDDKTYGKDASNNTLDPVADFAQYQADNAGSYLVNWSLATTQAKQIEAIITQKYIAVNFINSQEGWNEYRRTGFPVSSTSTTDPNKSMVSTLSQSTHSDKLPTRILYPASEYSYNANNVPQGISPYTSTIFWAH
jgi:hypothetical protein